MNQCFSCVVLPPIHLEHFTLIMVCLWIEWWRDGKIRKHIGFVKNFTHWLKFYIENQKRIVDRMNWLDCMNELYMLISWAVKSITINRKENSFVYLSIYIYIYEYNNVHCTAITKIKTTTSITDAKKRTNWHEIVAIFRMIWTIDFQHKLVIVSLLKCRSYAMCQCNALKMTTMKIFWPTKMKFKFHAE